MTDENEIVEGLPIACLLPASEGAARGATVQATMRQVQEVRELVDGYALRFSDDGRRLAALAEFMTFERECCPFLRFELHAEQQFGPLWLRLRGPEGTKEFIAGWLAAERSRATAGNSPS